jgi:hypothetical protein
MLLILESILHSSFQGWGWVKHRVCLSKMRLTHLDRFGRLPPSGPFRCALNAGVQATEKSVLRVFSTLKSTLCLGPSENGCIGLTCFRSEKFCERVHRNFKFLDWDRSLPYSSALPACCCHRTCSRYSLCDLGWQTGPALKYKVERYPTCDCENAMSTARHEL